MSGFANLDLPTDLACDLRSQREAANVIAALVEALERPDIYDFRECNGELFVTPKVSPELPLTIASRAVDICGCPRVETGHPLQASIA
jgi:hypothetical protein